MHHNDYRLIYIMVLAVLFIYLLKTDTGRS